MDPTNEDPGVYHAYLLRLWRVQSQGQTQWRASLESPHTGERQSFASLEQLFAFLRERCEGRALSAGQKNDTTQRRQSDDEI